jgi:hypothetical protein
MSAYPDILLELCSNPDEKLLSLLAEVHLKASERQNGSSIAFDQAAAGSGSFTNAVISALATTGGLHAPLIQAREWIFKCSPNQIRDALNAGLHIPGWGNSFCKNFDVDLLGHIDHFLATHSKDEYVDAKRYLNEITNQLHRAKILVHPNLAAYTAITAELIGLPRGLEPLLLIYGRLPAWAKRFQLIQKQTPKLA